MSPTTTIITALAILVLLLSLRTCHQDRRLEAAAAEAAALRQDTTLLRSRVAHYAGAVRRQNAAVGALRAEGERQQARVDSAARVAARARRRARVLADSILTLTLPAACDSAAAWAGREALTLTDRWRTR